MKKSILFLTLFAGMCYADIHDLSNLPLQVDAGSAASPGIFLNEEGEGETPEGERDGFYDSVEGEDGIGVSVAATSIGKFLSTGWNGAVVGGTSGAHVGSISFPAGSNTAPSIFPTGDTNTGIYSGTANTLYFATDGTLRLTLGTTLLTSTLPLVLPAGTVGAPCIYPTGDANTGIYFSGADTVDVSTGGVQRLSISATATTSTLPIVIPAGAAATPSIYPTGDANTGLYSAGADSLNLTTGGTLRLSLTATELTNTLPYVFPLGAAATPSLYPVGDDNTGLYSSGADNLNFTTGGTLRLTLSTTSLTSTLPILIPNGTAGAPALSFPSDSDTGFYYRATNDFAAATGGAERLVIDGNGLTLTGDFGVFPGNDGTASAPGFLFGQPGATNYAGIFCNSGGNIGIERAGIESILYGANDITLSRSAGVLTETRTVYNAAAAHGSFKLRATRGTSASPDYLDDGDIVHDIIFEAMDGAGTWGQAAAISVEAIQDHASGKTGSELVLSATHADTDTMQRVASARIYDLLGAGVYWIDLVDTRGIAPITKGGDWGLIYAADVVASLTGCSMLRLSDGVTGLMLDEDGFVGFASSNDSSSAYGAGSIRIGDDGAGGLTFQKENTGWEQHFRVSADGAQVEADEAFYLGDPATDGTWRIIRDGNNLLHQRRETGSYVTKDTITP